MTTYKPVREYAVDEVVVWVECIGLDSGPFKENAVDGDMLCHLTPEELSGDLGLSGLQGALSMIQLSLTKPETNASRRTEKSRNSKASCSSPTSWRLLGENVEETGMMHQHVWLN